MEHYDSLCDLLYIVVQGVFMWLAEMPDGPTSLSVQELLSACHSNESTFACMQFVFMPGGGVDFWKFRGHGLRVSDAESISDYMSILAGACYLILSRGEESRPGAHIIHIMHGGIHE